MSIIRSALHHIAGQKGQVLILFVGVFTIIVVAGAIAVDFGIWMSERRGAQTDSDLITLAGAYELLDSSVTLSDVDLATQQSALDNGVDPAGELQNLAVRSLAFPDGYGADPDYCHAAPDTGGRLNAVVLDVDRPSGALFASIFGVAAPDIGAHACARAGSLRTTSGLKPWSVPMYTSPCFQWIDDGDTVKGPEDQYIPLFGQDCVFRIDNPSQVGAIRLGDELGDPCSGPASGGAQKYRENIVEGSPAICEVSEMIDTEPGLEPNPTKVALALLLAGEGACDALNATVPDGIDDFDESYLPSAAGIGPTATFAPRDCETPRAMSIVIVDQFSGTGFDSKPIRGFAAFFLYACEKLDNDGNVIGVYRKCDFNGVKFQIRGFFMSILYLEGEIGDFDDFGTSVIRLAE